MKLIEIRQGAPHFKCNPCQTRLHFSFDWFWNSTIRESKNMHAISTVFGKNFNWSFLSGLEESYIIEIEAIGSMEIERLLFRCNRNLYDKLRSLADDSSDIILTDKDGGLLTGKEDQLCIEQSPRLTVGELGKSSHKYLVQNPGVQNFDFISSPRLEKISIKLEGLNDLENDLEPAWFFAIEGFRYSEADYNFFRVAP